MVNKIIFYIKLLKNEEKKPGFLNLKSFSAQDVQFYQPSIIGIV